VAHVEFVDQTLRDGPQSLWGMRIRGGMATVPAPWLDRAGYAAVDVPSGSFFTVQLRYLREDPLQTLPHIRRLLRHSKTRCGIRPSSSGRYGISPYSVMDFYVEAMVRLGIDSFWIYDCLYDMGEMERLARVIHAAGAEAVPAVMYGISPLHTDEWFATRVREMVSWGVTAAIYVEDASGILTPERARTLLPALVQAAGDVPVELHCHNTTGLAPVNYLIGVEAGVRRLHTASRAMANGPSLPSTEMTLANLEARGHTHDIDPATLEPVARHMAAVAQQEGHPVGGLVNEYDARIYDHQLPGGMTGTFKAQLAQHGMEDRFDAVLEEIPRVREELGHPVSATPFSQFIGTQALMNILSGERYSTTIDELALYVQGAYGQPPAPIDQDAKDRILSTPRGRELTGWTRPTLTLDEVRREYAGTTAISDDELLRLHFAPLEDVQATRAAGPMRPDYPLRDPVSELVALALDRRNVRRLTIQSGEMTVDLRR
jgi:oxaloacetate decarboxylase (Na+ extruding) subunit alpha